MDTFNQARGALAEDTKSALKARLNDLQQETQEIEEEIAQSRRKLESVKRERDALVALLEIWEPNVRFAPSTVGPTSLNGDASLPDKRNADVADLVVALLEEKGKLHYREIERELRARGLYFAGGVDPANTLLAKYFDDKRLYRPSRGVYAVRPAGETPRSVGARRKMGGRSRRRA